MYEARADLTANVWKVLVAPGDAVTKGQTLAILESMKMEINVDTGVAGIVASVGVEEGGIVHEGDVIATIRPEGTTSTSR